MDDFMSTLWAVLEERKENPRPGSYTNALLDGGTDAMARKVGEEAIEVILAAKGEGTQRLVAESADLIYHLMVLLLAHDVSWAQVVAELSTRAPKRR